MMAFCRGEAERHPKAAFMRRSSSFARFSP